MPDTEKNSPDGWILLGDEMETQRTGIHKCIITTGQPQILNSIVGRVCSIGLLLVDTVASRLPMS